MIVPKCHMYTSNTKKSINWLNRWKTHWLLNLSAGWLKDMQFVWKMYLLWISALRNPTYLEAKMSKWRNDQFQSLFILFYYYYFFFLLHCFCVDSSEESSTLSDAEPTVQNSGDNNDSYNHYSDIEMPRDLPGMSWMQESNIITPRVRIIHSHCYN